MEHESFADFLKRVREESRKGTKTGYAEFEWDGFTATRAETAARTAYFKIDYLRMREEMFKQKLIEEDELLKNFYNIGIDYGSKPDMSYSRPVLSAKKQDTIKKLTVFMNDSAATLGEKENAKRLIEKIKAGV